MRRLTMIVFLLLGGVWAQAATYQELASLFRDSALTNKVAVACIIAADDIRQEDPGTANHANRLIWAKQAFQAPRSKAQEMMPALLAANKDASVAQIEGATDAAIQSSVDAAVDIFATGE